jgi:hypothetical protein
MGFRFRKSFGGRGARVNLSWGRGASFSFGGRGSTTNVSSRGLRQTFSIPGTGISYSTSTGSGRRKRAEGGILHRLVAWVILIALVRWGWIYLTESDSPPKVAQTASAPAGGDNAVHKSKAAHKAHAHKAPDTQISTPQTFAAATSAPVLATAAAPEDSKIDGPDSASNEVTAAPSP